MPAARIVCFGSFRFDALAGTLLNNGKSVAIQPQPARVLALLTAHAGDVVTREQLRREIWADSWVNFDQGLNYCIRQLRLALHDEVRAPRFIQTLPQRGYRFIATVSVSEPPTMAPENSAPSRVVFKVRYAAAAALLSLGLLLGLQVATVVVRELAPPSEASALAEQLQPLHLLRGTWTHHLSPFISTRLSR